VPPFPAGPCRETGLLIGVSQIVEIEAATAHDVQRHRGIGPPEALRCVAGVIEDATALLDGARRKEVDADVADRSAETDSVEVATDVWGVPDRNQPLGAIGHLLSTDSQDGIGRDAERQPQIDEGLLDIQRVEIGRRGKVLPGRKMAAELDERPHIVTGMQIGMQQGSLQQIGVR
jgi:hypothetical protein